MNNVEKVSETVCAKHPPGRSGKRFRTPFLLLGAELQEMAAARWELARLELESDMRSVARLAIIWSISAVAALTALPLAVVALSEALDGWLGIARDGWLLLLAAGLFILAMGGGYCAWRRFRRTFTGLRETMEELREDLVWLKEGRRT